MFIQLLYINVKLFGVNVEGGLLIDFYPNLLIFSMIPVVEKPSTIGLIATLPPLAITSFVPTICSIV